MTSVTRLIKLCLIAILLCSIGIGTSEVSAQVQSQTAKADEEKTISFKERLKNWDKLQKSINRALNNDMPILDERMKTYRDSLRELRLAATEESVSVKEQLAGQNELFAALGDAPEDPEKEEKTIRDQRKTLGKIISELDANLKKANLVIAKIDKLGVTLDKYEQQLAEALLFSRIDMPLTMEAWQSFKQEVALVVSTLRMDIYLAAFMFGMIVIIAMGQPVARYLNNFVREAKTIVLLKEFSSGSVVAMAMFAYFVFLFRFGALNLEQSFILEILVNIIVSIGLSLSLYTMLGKVHFKAPEYNKDAMGEKRQGYYWLWNTITRFTRLALVLLPAAVLLGYVNLAQYVSFNILATVFAAILFFLLRTSVVRISNALSMKKDSDEELSPIAITIVEPVIALLSIVMILFFWGMTSDDLKTFIDDYRHGISIGEITINFAAVFSAVGFFFGLYYVTKIIQWFLSSRVFPYTKLDSGVRDAVTTVTGYVGVAVALLTAFSVVGLNMSNLAIVAGALSVGIGFGLQAIFSNFVSGLILLFERPVKVGDWVFVGDQEGIIKKIRVRSTEIETFWNSSIIVPNSQLISETVTNWTLHDKVGRLDIVVGTSYSSDVDQVKEVLLDVAKEHPQVRIIPEPKVLFMNFGDSSLDFELRCFVRDIGNRLSIASELRFAICKAFREHNIEIPFPQRDLHMVSMQQPVTVLEAEANTTANT